MRIYTNQQAIELGRRAFIAIVALRAKGRDKQADSVRQRFIDWCKRYKYRFDRGTKH